MAISVHFTRSGSIENLIEARVRAARRSLDAALYRFSNQKLVAALNAAGGRGVAIRIVINSNGHEEEYQVIGQTLLRLGIPLRTSGGRAAPGSKMHHKFAIFDGEAVITGSYNWTMESEEKNYENIVILDDSEAAAAYQKEFNRLWAEAREVPPA